MAAARRFSPSIRARRAAGPWSSTRPVGPSARRSRSCRSISQTRAGSSTTPKTSGATLWPWHAARSTLQARRPPTSLRSASPISARPRCSGTGRRASRCTRQSSGRTAARPRSAIACGPRVTRPWFKSAAACCSIPISRPARLPGCSTPLRDCGRGPSAARSPSARSIAFCSGASPAARCTRPTRPTLRAPCSTTFASSAGIRIYWRSSMCRRRCCPRCATATPSSAPRLPTCSAVPCRSLASPAISRRRPWARPASSRA